MSVAAGVTVLAACGQSAGEPVRELDTPPVETVTLAGADASTTTSSSSAPPVSSSLPSATTQPGTTPAPLRSLTARPVETQAEFPVLVASPPADERIFIVGKEGTVWSQVRDGGPETLVLDLGVSGRSEQGLLGLAFHPDFRADPRAFVDYTDLNGNTVVSQFTLSDAGTFVDEVVLLTIDQPAANHNGGMVSFGPDGYLYVALGDGGGANDQYGHGGNPATLLGTLLRVDVSVPGIVTVPPDNPFVDGGGAPEVWAYGLRNPWRFTFDGDWLIVADVGQQSYEEINRVSADAAGLDYGWSRMEGAHCFAPAQGCDPSGLVVPVVEIPHGEAGTCSVTGGLVYRGAEIPEVAGQYFYSDYCGGYLRSLVFSDGSVVEHLDWSDEVGPLGRVTSLGSDGVGELFITTAEGTVYRLEAER